MILQQTKNGFLRHNSLEGNKNKEQGAKNAPHKGEYKLNCVNTKIKD